MSEFYPEPVTHSFGSVGREGQRYQKVHPWQLLLHLEKDKGMPIPSLSSFNIQAKQHRLDNWPNPQPTCKRGCSYPEQMENPASKSIFRSEVVAVGLGPGI
jgi:hypothetical protein